MEERGIRKYFDILILSAEEGVAKPDPEIFRRALERAGCEPDEAVMIGDRLDNDIIPAAKLGMKTVWVRRGGIGLHESEKAGIVFDETVDSVAEIPRIFGMQKTFYI